MTRDRAWFFIALALFFASRADASIQTDLLIYRQLPNRTFGFDADTLNQNESGQLSGQLVADRFTLSQASEICQVRWWGFYGSSLATQVEPPPLSETTRIQFYSDAAGLPGTVLVENTILNPSRQSTGVSIPTGPNPPEYVYQAPLLNCFSPQPGVPYWIEIAQLGDSASRFRWEGSNGGEFAVRFPLETPYRLIGGLGQLSYELRTPEPCSGALFGLGFAYLLRTSRRDGLNHDAPA